MFQGVVVWTLLEGTQFPEDQRGQKVSRRRSGTMEARRGRGWGFSLSRESQSCSCFVIIAVFVIFMSVLEEGLRPKVLAINVLKNFQPLYAVGDLCHYI